ncbi:hypothetical protein [Blastococcus xanthinilyticus]|uniref:Uncharacterized protein n=1 Tax=Blastococcus xanthinilyticus TaxID=1564164 RepID=A0A5S5CLA3_9ACTN|nr:hypothetical protein [Blastococcus xanthinilyticus]TYP81967.1 hypothetical protein BD833_12117 [Blastococcus xanthinilyticus]
MRCYADSPALRARQLAADLGVLAWAVLWVLVARTAHGAVLVLAEPGRAVEGLGRSVADSMGSAAGTAEELPVVGDELAAPFGALADAGGSVGGAGRSAQGAVETLAAILAVVLVVLPVGWLVVRWLPGRLRYARDAAAAARLVASGADLDVLATRAAATAPLERLAALPAGTGAAWRAGNPAATRDLAALELGRLGLRLPAGGPQPATSPPTTSR